MKKIKNFASIGVNFVKLPVVFLSSLLLLPACSTSPSSQGVGETLATGLFIGGLAKYPKEEDGKKDLSNDKNNAYGLMVAGVLTYYLVGKLNNYSRKKEIKRKQQEAERKKQEEWNSNNCDSRKKKIAINKIKMEDSYKANNRLLESKKLCSTLVGVKPLSACNKSEKDLYGIAMCSQKIGGCEKTYNLFPNVFSKAITTQSCATTLSKLKQNKGFDKLDESIRSINIAGYDKIAEVESKEGNKWMAVGAKLFANNQRKEQFEDCTYKVSKNCSSKYEVWKKSHTRLDKSCVLGKMGGVQNKILSFSLIEKIKKEKVEFNSLCK